MCAGNKGHGCPHIINLIVCLSPLADERNIIVHGLVGSPAREGVVVTVLTRFLATVGKGCVHSRHGISLALVLVVGGGQSGLSNQSVRTRPAVADRVHWKLLPLGDIGGVLSHGIGESGNFFAILCPAVKHVMRIRCGSGSCGIICTILIGAGNISSIAIDLAVVAGLEGDGVPRSGTLDGGNREVNHSAICKSQICIAIRGIIRILVKITGGIKRDGIGERVDIAAAFLLYRIAQLPCKSVFTAAHALGQREINAGSHRVGNGCTADIDARGGILSNRFKCFVQRVGVGSIICICTARCGSCGNGITQEGANSGASRSFPTAVPAQIVRRAEADCVQRAELFECLRRHGCCGIDFRTACRAVTSGVSIGVNIVRRRAVGQRNGKLIRQAADRIIVHQVGCCTQRSIQIGTAVGGKSADSIVGTGFTFGRGDIRPSQYSAGTGGERDNGQITAGAFCLAGVCIYETACSSLGRSHAGLRIFHTIIPPTKMLTRTIVKILRSALGAEFHRAGYVDDQHGGGFAGHGGRGRARFDRQRNCILIGFAGRHCGLGNRNAALFVGAVGIGVLYPFTIDITAVNDRRR